MLNIFSLKTRKNQTSLLLDKAEKVSKSLKLYLSGGQVVGAKKWKTRWENNRKIDDARHFV